MSVSLPDGSQDRTVPASTVCEHMPVGSVTACLSACFAEAQHRIQPASTGQEHMPVGQRSGLSARLRPVSSRRLAGAATEAHSLEGALKLSQGRPLRCLLLQLHPTCAHPTLSFNSCTIPPAGDSRFKPPVFTGRKEVQLQG